MNELQNLMNIYNAKTELEKEIIKHLYQLYGYEYTKKYLQDVNKKSKEVRKE